MLQCKETEEIQDIEEEYDYMNEEPLEEECCEYEEDEIEYCD